MPAAKAARPSKKDEPQPTLFDQQPNR
jgi:hypothetical protein